MILEGTYNGKNVYVQNPRISDTLFCTKRVVVNGNEISFRNADAYEIDLKKLGLKEGEKVEVIIVHNGNCKPKVLVDNSSPRSTFEIIDIGVDTNGLFRWSTKNEQSKLMFMVEQFRWNKWMRIGEVEGQGIPDTCTYFYKVALHSGTNHFRVRQIGAHGYPRVSPAVQLNISNKKFEKPRLNQSEKQIEFSDSTLYEMYDVSGNLLKKGSGKVIDCADLKNETYWLNYDNNSIEIKIKWE